MYEFLEENRDVLVAAKFNTVWSPPIGVFNKMVKMGFQITAYYFEPGMCFCGIYSNGKNDYIPYNNLKNIPKEIRDVFDTDSYFEDVKDLEDPEE